MPAFKKFATYAPAGKFEGEPTYKRELYRIIVSIILLGISKSGQNCEKIYFKKNFWINFDFS